MSCHKQILSIIFLSVGFNISGLCQNVVEEWHSFKKFSDGVYYFMNYDSSHFLYLGGERENWFGRDSIVVSSFDSQTGSFRWEDTLSAPFDYSCHIRDLLLSNENELYVAGYYDSICTTKSLLVKYDSLGNVLWDSRNPFNDQPCVDGHLKSIAIKNNNEIISIELSGYADGVRIGKTSGGITTALNSIPDLTFNQSRYANALALDGTEQIYFVADSIVTVLETFYRIYFLDQDGTTIWNNDSLLTQLDYKRPVDLKIDSSNRAIVLLNNYSTDGSGNLLDQEIEILKYDVNGNVLWDRFIDTAGSTMETGYRIQTDAFNNILVSGSFEIGGQDIGMLIKLNSTGNTLWSRFFGASSENIQITVDKYNDIYVANTDNDGMILKYDEHGDFLWSYDFPNLPYFELNPYNLIVDDSFNIYVFGQYDNSVWDSVGTMLVKLSQPGLAPVNEVKNTAAQISIYPIPSSSLLFVSSTQPIYSFTIHDLLGREVLQQNELNEKRLSIPLNGFFSGVYLIKIKTAYGEMVKKFIVE